MFPDSRPIDSTPGPRSEGDDVRVYDVPMLLYFCLPLKYVAPLRNTSPQTWGPLAAFRAFRLVVLLLSLCYQAEL